MRTFSSVAPTRVWNGSAAIDDEARRCCLEVKRTRQRGDSDRPFTNRGDGRRFGWTSEKRDSTEANGDEQGEASPLHTDRRAEPDP